MAPLLWRRSADPTASAWALFRANSEIYLEAASTNEAYRQIVLIDGPAVLGWQYLSERHDGPTHTIAAYLRGAVDEGVLEPQPIEPLAHLLAALGAGSAMYVAHADDPEEARREITECYERFLSGLGLTDAPTAPLSDTPPPTSVATVAAGRHHQKGRPWPGISPPNRSFKRSWTGLDSSSPTRSSRSTSSTPTAQFHPLDDELRPIVDPMKQEVRDHDLWAAHLGPELGGKGYGQVKLALLNEILGVSGWAPIVFGTQAPDTGNAEIIAHYGTEEQKEKYLQPLLNGEVFSCYSMTEPQAGSDPQQFTTAAVKDGDEWVINGWKFFSSNARTAAFLIVMAITDPDVSIYKGASMFLVPTDTPGVNMARHVGPGRRVRGRGHARPHPLRGRAGPGREPAGRRGPGLRHRPDPAGRRSGAPRHADRGHLPAGPRPVVRAGAQPRDAGQPVWPRSSSSRGTSPTPTPSWPSSACWSSTRPGRSTSTRTTAAPARTSPPSRPSPRRSSTTPCGAPCTPMGHWACRTRCRSAACG